MIPFAFSWSDDTIAGAEGLDDAAILAELDRGARVVLIDSVVSLLALHYAGRELHLVRPGESVGRLAAPSTLITALLGWWGLGLFFTPRALYRNLTGGLDVTAQAHAMLEAKLARRTAQAAERRAALEGLLARPLEERRAAALPLIERRQLDEAWLLVGPAIEDGTLRRDLDLLRRLLLAAHHASDWPRAERAALILYEQHRDALTGIVGGAARDALLPEKRRAARQPGPVVRFLHSRRGMRQAAAAALVATLLGIVGWNLWLEAHRTLHIVNGTGDPVIVEIAGADPTRLALGPGDRGELVVAEGPLVTTIRRGGTSVTRTHTLHVAALARFGEVAAILNVEGAALLTVEELTYGPAPHHVPRTEPLLFGEELVVLEDTYAFRRPPAKGPAGSWALRIDAPLGTVDEVLAAAPATSSRARLLEWLELRLRLAPEDGQALAAYLGLGQDTGARRTRVRTFLEQGLTAHPSWKAAHAEARRRELAGAR